MNADSGGMPSELATRLRAYCSFGYDLENESESDGSTAFLGAILELQNLSSERQLMAFELYALGVAYYWYGSKHSDNDREEYFEKSFASLEMAFTQAKEEGIVKCLPAVERDTERALDQVSIASELLLLKSDFSAWDDSALERELREFIWRESDQFEPELNDFALDLTFSGQPEAGTAVALELIRRSVRDPMCGNQPVPFSIDVANQSLQALSEKARSEGNENIAAVCEQVETTIMGSDPSYSDLLSIPTIQTFLRQNLPPRQE